MNALRKNIVLDSNLVVSAFLNPRGAAGEALCLALEHFEVITSPDTISELADVLKRDKFDRYLSKSDRLERLRLYATNSITIHVREIVTECKDPKDNKFLALALESKAIALVSGDKKDLVSMNPFRGIPIIGVREFIETHEKL